MTRWEVLIDLCEETCRTKLNVEPIGNNTGSKTIQAWMACCDAQYLIDMPDVVTIAASLLVRTGEEYKEPYITEMLEKLDRQEFENYKAYIVEWMITTASPNPLHHVN